MEKGVKEVFSDLFEKTKAAFTPRRPQKADIIKLVCFIGALCILFASAVLIISASVQASVSDRVFAVGEAPEKNSAECILVFGALVREDGTLSDMLRDRVITGARLYFQGVAPKILMSGDGDGTGYDETAAMRDYAIELGVPAEDIICDTLGLSTYDSVFRARNVYGLKTVVLVSQEYHLYRGLYISEKLGVSAVGVSADLEPYRNQIFRDVREIFARAKDFFVTLTEAEPKYIG